MILKINALRKNSYHIQLLRLQSRILQCLYTQNIILSDLEKMIRWLIWCDYLEDSQKDFLYCFSSGNYFSFFLPFLFVLFFLSPSHKTLKIMINFPLGRNPKHFESNELYREKEKKTINRTWLMIFFYIVISSWFLVYQFLISQFVGFRSFLCYSPDRNIGVHRKPVSFS